MVTVCVLLEVAGDGDGVGEVEGGGGDGEVGVDGGSAGSGLREGLAGDEDGEAFVEREGDGVVGGAMWGEVVELELADGVG